MHTSVYVSIPIEQRVVSIPIEQLVETGKDKTDASGTD
jgi:hypothetical protein